MFVLFLLTMISKRYQTLSL